MSAVPRGNTGAAISITFTTIGLLTLLARLYTRLHLTKNAGLEDLAIVFAWVFSLTHTTLVCVGECRHHVVLSQRIAAYVYKEVHNGLGGHSWDFSLEDLLHILLPFYISVPMYTVSLFLTKVSILLLYMRLFPVRRFALACWGTVALLLIFVTWALFGFTFMCTPVSYFWDKALDGHCMDPRLIYFTNAPFNILTDFILFGLPLPILAPLQLPRKQKLVLVLLFAFGLVGCLTSILRLRSLYLLSVSVDLTYDNLDAAIWSCVEANVGICCACVPTLKPLIAAIHPRLLFEQTLKRSKGTGNDSNIQGSDIILVMRDCSHRAYAQFDNEGPTHNPEAGKVEVTTTIFQDLSNDSDTSTKGLRLA